MGDSYFIRDAKERNYTVVSNELLQNTTLSFKAKGLMCYLLSLPDDWKIHLKEICKHSSDGIDSVRSAIKELEKAGYIHKERISGEHGYAEWIYHIIENPTLENPYMENPYMENPYMENPTLLNTNSNKVLTQQNTNSNIRGKEKQFKKPSVEEVADYCKERNNTINPQQFCDFYESKNWYVGKNKMKDWKACIRTWENNQKNKQTFKRSGAYDVACNHIDESHDYNQDKGIEYEDGDIGF